VFADTWLESWLTEISADAREAAVHYSRVRNYVLYKSTATAT